MIAMFVSKHPNTMTDDPLAPSKLISIVNKSAATISSPLEAISVFCYACMFAAGFRFLGFGEDHRAGISA
jgi:hypothetical protein